MDTFIGLLKLALLALATYSYIKYSSRRSDSKTALQRLKESPVLRELTPAEALTLTPFLANAGVTAHSDLGVRSLDGPYVRHGLYGDGSTLEHNTIGEVDVLLPYDAIDYVEDYNNCEVVLAQKFVVVVRLNNFSLTEGRERSMAQRTTQSDEGALEAEVLESTNPGVVSPPVVVTLQTAAERNDARYRAGEADVLDARMESAEEVASRRSGSGWDAVWRCAAAFVLIWIASWDSTDFARNWLLLTALVFLAWAGWCMARKPSQSPAEAAPQPVQKIRGLLRRIDMVNVNNNYTAGELFLGDANLFKLPFHWNEKKLGLVDNVIDAEVRTFDHQVLGLGPGWSIADESQRFPAVTWGRYLSLFLVGLLAWIAVWLTSPPPNTQIGLAWARIKDTSTSQYSSADSLAAKMPKVGDRVEMRGQARCGVTLSSDDVRARRLPPSDCSTVRWGGEAPLIPDLALAPVLAQLTKPDFIRSVDDPEAVIRAATIANLQSNLGMRYPLGGYSALYESKAQLISDLGRTLNLVNEACEQGLKDCPGLQTKVFNALKEELKNEENKADFVSWKTLVASAQAGKSNAKVLVPEQLVAKLRIAARETANDQATEKALALVPGVLPSQRAGVLLQVAGPPWSNQAEKSQHGFSQRQTEDAWEYWAALQYFGSTGSMRNFEFAGTVVDIRNAPDGTPLLNITLESYPHESRLALVYTLWWGLAVIVTLCALVMLIWRARLAWIRNRLLEEDIASRPPASDRAIF